MPSHVVIPHALNETTATFRDRLHDGLPHQNLRPRCLEAQRSQPSTCTCNLAVRCLHSSVRPPRPHQPWDCHLWPAACRRRRRLSEQSAQELLRHITAAQACASCLHRLPSPRCPLTAACTQRLPDAQHSLCHALPGQPVASFGICVESVSSACDADTGRHLKGLGGERIPLYLACNALHQGGASPLSHPSSAKQSGSSPLCSSSVPATPLSTLCCAKAPL